MKKEFWSDMAGLGIMLLVMLGAAALRAPFNIFRPPPQAENHYSVLLLLKKKKKV